MNKTGICFSDAVVGMQLGEALNYATKEAIQAYARATEDFNPLYWEESAAQAAGFRSVIAPAGFHIQNTALKWATGVANYIPRGSIHTKEHYQLCGVVCAGDCLKTTVSISDKFEKKGRNYLVYRCTITNQLNQVVAVNEMEFIISEGKEEDA